VGDPYGERLAAEDRAERIALGEIRQEPDPEEDMDIE
jgi:hypothetical protein